MGSHQPMTRKEIVERGRRVLRMETEALAETERRIGEDFARAVECIARSEGRVIVSGVGKSGLVGRKIAATLTSTGTPATFLHPADSVHGDLGIVGKSDVAILISKSGESDEVLGLLDHLKRLGVSTIALTSNTKSTLARDSDVALDAWVKEEACPHDLAPTTSTTVALALGDALAIALLEEKGFDANDFARLHPGGAIGRRLLTRVSDVMITGNLPILPESGTMREAVVQLAERRGIAIVTAKNGSVSGVITTGDLSRLMEHEENVFPIPVTKVMNKTPKIARSDELGSAVVYRMETHGIIAMPVLNGDDRIVGVIHLHDLMRAGVV
jgi:arabinose-5-phosphate isomerase